jgi:predicted DNA-binding transcriptional regulator YafY
MKSMEGFFTQARRNLGPESSAHLEREWLAKVRVVATGQPLLPPKIAPGIFEAVSEALYLNRWLHLDYRNAAGKRNKVDVMPLGLVQQGPRLYLVCRYRGYDNERNLALHRILSAEMSTLTFDRPKEFDLKKYDDDGRFGFGDGEKIRLSFRIKRDAGLHLLESPLSSDQQVVELDDGTLEVTATVVDSAMLEWWLRGFGDAVTYMRKHPVIKVQER